MLGICDSQIARSSLADVDFTEYSGHISEIRLAPLKELVRPMLKHPQLLAMIPGGMKAVSRGHAGIEIRRARKLQETNESCNLGELVGKICDSVCLDYQGVYLYATVRETKPSVVVETGVASGVSSYAILQAMRDNAKGFLYSIDLPNASLSIPGGNSPGYLVPGGLKERWKILLGDSGTLLNPLLEQIGAIDIFVHDSLHTYDHMTYEYETAWPHLRQGGLLMSDDIESSSAFRDFCSRHGVRGTVLERKQHGYRISFGWVTKS